ncbi:MAG: glycoside hydrolase 43 family protein [Armatimonadetes bacterium]|nr:glycoside hydrolase 43 family protein [Armatimonadota bacterium]
MKNTLLCRSLGLFAAAFSMVAMLATSPAAPTQAALRAQPVPVLTWTGDNRNGTFTNPVLYGDYPDPDIIRVGKDFYLATTTFVSVPGLEILHSRDLINWDIAGYALPTLDFDPRYSLTGGSEYAQGVWAPCLRYHGGKFYIVDNIQGVGTVVLRAHNPAGPWTMNRLNAGLFDPGLMFDDGTPLVYNGTGGHISVAVLDSDLRHVLSNTLAYTLPHSGGEGSHAYKINGMYYVLNAVYARNATIACSRSQHRDGPFTSTTVCANAMPWHAPHQGGIVQLPNGDWWGFSLADAGPVGRTTWVGPITWKDGWPYFGDPAAPGFPVTSPKPKVGTFPVTPLPASDEFSGPMLGLQWEWNHNPDDTKWSLSARRGYLRLQTQTAPNLTNARNTLTQRTEGPRCTGVIKIDTGHLQPGDRAGLCLLEQNFGYLAVYRDADGQRVVRVVNQNGDLKAPAEDVTDTAPAVPGATLWLEAHCDFDTNTAQFSYSTDGNNFTQLGGDFPMHFTLATFQGERFGIFDYNPAGSSGWLDVDYFHEEGASLPKAAAVPNQALAPKG